MRRSVFVVILAALLASGFVATVEGRRGFALSAHAQENAPMEVKIDNFSFTPPTLTVPAGTTVTWTNRDDIPHTVVSTDDPKSFKSKVLDTDEKFSFTFSKAGTYPYFCSIHPKMTGKVIVQ
jgi:amicyanin